MLAICSDLDETPDSFTYFETIKFLNTIKETFFGNGVGLEVGNTIYFDMPNNQFSYWNADEKSRAIIRELIHSGHIDCLHSYGDLATKRAHAERAIEELSKYNCKLEVWIDHGKAPSNFGSDIMCGQGDVIESEVYHADITIDYGIKYVWRGRVTSVIGQDAPRCLKGIYTSRHPVASSKTFGKEYIKGILGYVGYSKYAMHHFNKIIREVTLRSGQKVFEFMRANPHWRGVSSGDTAEGLGEILVDRVLSNLVEREGVCILYTHLGKFKRNCKSFSPLTIKAFNLLGQYSQEGKILVTTTRRLLNYCKVISSINIVNSFINDTNEIDISIIGCKEEDLQGLSLYVRIPEKTRFKINGKEVKKLRFNPPDHTGMVCVSLPWQPLELPDFR